MPTNLTDSTSSSKYNLDESDHSPILVYNYRKGVTFGSQHELSEYVNKGNAPFHPSCLNDIYK